MLRPSSQRALLTPSRAVPRWLTAPLLPGGSILVQDLRNGHLGDERRIQMPPTSVKLVNIIPQSMSHETNNDSEPNLTVNPSNPQLMAASAFTPVQQGAAPIFVSQDGGNTWVLSTVIPSDRITTDITLRFSGNGDTLYAGILPRPFTHTDPLGHAISSLNILRTKTPLGPAKMQVLVDRTGTQG